MHTALVYPQCYAFVANNYNFCLSQGVSDCPSDCADSVFGLLRAGLRYMHHHTLSVSKLEMT